MIVKTVRIAADVTRENPHGYVVINESDFDEREHLLWVDPATAPPPAKDAEKSSASYKAGSKG